MVLKMAVIADIHYGDKDIDTGALRKGSLGDILLLRAVHRLNRTIKPDITVLLGDLLNDGSGEQGALKRGRLVDIMQQIESPLLVLPGNHDGNPDDFYREFPRPPAWLDFHGYRLVPFIDVEEPGYHASRTTAGLQRMLDARAGWNGPMIQLQHTSLFPPGMHECPYHYTNIDQILEFMRKADIQYSVSAHYHRGIDELRTDHGTFIVSPALCESPFAFLELVFDKERVLPPRHPLQMPPELNLADFHIHTPLAYCSENMDPAKTVELAKMFGLAEMAFSEHSGHLYFPREAYWSGRCLEQGLSSADAADDRMAAYQALVDPCVPPARIALEVDCDFAGRPLLRERDRKLAEFLIGAIHGLPSLRGDPIDMERAADEFLAELKTFFRCGIAILAHPFRVFRRAHQPVPDSLYAPVIRLLKEYGVAAEINFHTNTPDPVFFEQCLRAGVKLTFGSDAHNLYEVGEFTPHLQLLAQCGFNGDLNDIMWRDVPGGLHEPMGDGNSANAGGGGPTPYPIKTSVFFSQRPDANPKP